MKKSSLLAVTLVLALASVPVLAAGDKHDKKGHGPGSSQGHGPRAQGQHDNGRHVGWQKSKWKRGDRIEVVYIEPTYYVDDYRSYELSAPPQGQRWVRPMDGRYLLVEVATGLIVEALGY